MTAGINVNLTPRLDSPAALQRFMRARFPLSAEQYEAATAPLAPAVVVAGAGSGKTTVMAARVVWLVGTGQVAPEQVLGLTFTTKAAGELAERIHETLHAAGILRPPGRQDRAHRPALGEPAEEPLEPTVATYHSYAAALLSEHGLRIGHEPDTRVITDGYRYQLAARVVAGYRGRVELLSDHPPTVIGYLLALDAAMSEHLVDEGPLRAFQDGLRPEVEAALTAEARKTARDDIEQVLSTMRRREELLGLVAAYRAAKRRLGLMEFSDQVELSARLAAECPEVGAAERAKFKVVLLDEYQDTSVAQAIMLRGLFSGPDPERGRGHPVTAVGDPNQAIYGWRGASVSNILRFAEDFPSADGALTPRYPLTVSRRSDRDILRVANALAKPLQDAHGLPPLRAPTDRGAGVVRADRFETYPDELAWLAGAVRQAHRSTGSWREIGVLTRDNAHAADVFASLTGADVPVEIVGLKGLLNLPEVAEVVATLTLLQDPTANAALLTLLTGPRWAIGVRDLALLGRRADALAGRAPVHEGAAASVSLEEELALAAAGADPVEVPSLSDALDDPGGGDYSADARERFGLLAAELRSLRKHAGEPLLDLVRRIVDTTGIDVELASSASPTAQARRANLDQFIEAVAGFQAVDGEISLPALLAYLRAEDEFGNGLDVATPTDADSVKLLTVHRAKGLEWDAVFLVGVCEEKFPVTRSRTRWTAGPGVLPYPLRGDARDLPALTTFDKAGLDAFKVDGQLHQEREERRLGYVAFTRARHLLSVSSHVWSPTRAKPLAPSPYQCTVAEMLRSLTGRAPDWPAMPGPDEPNPLRRAAGRPVPWPVDSQGPEVQSRLAAAGLVQEQITLLREPQPGLFDPEPAARLNDQEQALVDSWDTELELLLNEAHEARSTQLAVPLPSSLSATSLAKLQADPARFAEALARPMPPPPSPSARLGTRFHAYVESHFGAARQDALIDPDELSGRADHDITGEAELAELVELFRRSPLADRGGVVVEAPFTLVLAGQVVRGRIDAVFPEPDWGFLLIDWKTSRSQAADPVQLGIYRVAWAELSGVPLERVRAGFYYVRDQQLVEPADLPDRAALEAALTAASPGRGFGPDGVDPLYDRMP